MTIEHRQFEKGFNCTVIHALYNKSRYPDCSVCYCSQADNEETKERLYESLLAECRDTIQAVREELRTDVVRNPLLTPYTSLNVFISFVTVKKKNMSDALVYP